MSSPWPFGDYAQHALEEFNEPGFFINDKDQKIWDTLLKAEQAAVEMRKQEGEVAKCSDELIGVRIVGWFFVDFLHRPGPLGSVPYSRLRDAINSCNNRQPDEMILMNLEVTKKQQPFREGSSN